MPKTITFPLKGNDLDLETYYQMTPVHQVAARQWLNKEGTQEQKDYFADFEEQNQRRIKTEAMKNANDQALSANQHAAPHKHGQGSKKSNKKGGGCNIS